jgi:uncharacterized protein YjiK
MSITALAQQRLKENDKAEVQVVQIMVSRITRNLCGVTSNPENNTLYSVGATHPKKAGT